MSFPLSRRRAVALVATLLAAFVVQIALAPAARATESPTCTTQRLPVALAPGLSPDYHLSGRLCSVGDPAGKTLQILVHGFTLDRQYWDSPYRPDLYSYVQAMTGAGYATLSLDRIGVGDSDYPPAAPVTIEAHIFTLHQVIQQMRQSGVGGAPFDRVILVGHSYGTVAAVMEASRYRDVDGVIATGFLHTIDPLVVLEFVLAQQPAQLDAKFAGANLPLGYVTTRPGTRAPLFYTGNTDPAIVAQDEALKNTGTLGDVLTFGTYLIAIPKTVRAPVLLAVGGQDRFFCNILFSCANGTAIVNRERLFFEPGTPLEGYVQPGAGHNSIHEPSAQQFFAVAREWADRNVGAS